MPTTKTSVGEAMNEDITTAVAPARMTDSPDVIDALAGLKAEVASAEEVTITRDRYGYRVDGEFYRRVTTLCGGLPKPWLANWAAKSVAEFAVEHKERWEELPTTDAVKLLKSSPWSKRDDAGDRGTAVHKAAEAIVRGNPVPEDELANEDEIQCARAVERFVKARGSRILASELTVFSPAHGYAGTLDLWEVDQGGKFWLLDWKTSRDVYAEHAIQLTAYRHAEFAIVSKRPVDGKDEAWTGRVIPWGPERVDMMGVVHVEPGGCKLYPIRYSKRLWHTFRAAKMTKMYQLDTNDYNKTPRLQVFGDPLTYEEES